MSGRGLSERRDGAVEAFLEELGRVPVPAAGRGRLIVAIDATASREATWDQACAVQGQMFVEAAALGGLEVQLVFWRGFDECKASRWVADARALVDLMTRVRCRAGQTQIRRVLRHAIAEAGRRPVRALALIGDAVEEEVDELAGLAGELGIRGVRVFVFHEGGDARAERALREIARLSGGAYCRFDRASPQQLRELLGAVAAYAAGGAAVLEDLRRRPSAAVRLLAGQVRG